MAQFIKLWKRITQWQNCWQVQSWILAHFHHQFMNLNGLKENFNSLKSYLWGMDLNYFVHICDGPKQSKTAFSQINRKGVHCSWSVRRQEKVIRMTKNGQICIKTHKRVGGLRLPDRFERATTFQLVSKFHQIWAFVIKSPLRDCSVNDGADLRFILAAIFGA